MSINEDIQEKVQINIIELLLRRDMTRLCYQIYNKLDSKSLTNSRLVCHDWKNFIDYHFYELPKGRLHLKNQINANIFDKDFSPRIQTTSVSEDSEPSITIYDIKADKENICVSTDAGKILNYKFGCLDLHLWSLQVCDEALQLFMNSERIFAVNSQNEGHVYVIDRSRGIPLHTFLHIHLDPIYGVQVFENKILVTASNKGEIKFHEIGQFYQLKLMHREQRYCYVQIGSYTKALSSIFRNTFSCKQNLLRNCLFV